MKHLPVLLIVTPLIFAFFIPAFSLYIHRKYKLLTIIGSALTLALAIAAQFSNQIIYPVGGWHAPLGIVLVMDETTAFMTVFLGIIFLPVIKYSFHYIKRGGARYYYTVLFLLWASLNGMILTGDLFNMVVFIEISSVVTYALIAWDATPRALEAAFKYMFIGTLGAAFIILATIIIYNSTGALNIAAASELIHTIPPRVLSLCIMLYIAGFAAKLALFPAHWLADGHFAAPAPVSVLLSAGAMKVSIFALFRLLYNLFGWDSVIVSGAANILLYMGAVTALFGSILALGQTNLKRMLAFSSVTQVGFIVMALSLGSSAGITAGFFHMVNHGFMKGALFLSVGTFAAEIGSEELDDLRGMGRTMPLQGLAFTVGSLAIVGIPVFNGFFSKWLIGENLALHPNPLPLIALVIASVLGVIYYFNALRTLYSKPATSSRYVHSGLSSPTLIFALLCLLLGLLPTLPLSWLERATQAMLNYATIPGKIGP